MVPGRRTPDYTGGAFSYGSGSGDQGWYDNVVAVDPTNPNHVLAGGIALVETTDGGATWTNVNGQAFFGGGTNNLHPDQHALAFGPDGKVWTGDDGGVYLYNPSGPTVTNANGNLNITQFYFGFNEVGGTVLAGSQDNASARTGNSAQRAWTGIWSGDGGPSAVTPNHPATQFIEADSDLYRTSDAFATDLTDITPAGVLRPFTPPVAVVPSTSTPANPTVFYGGSDLYRTTNPSSPSPTWTQVTSVGGIVSALAVSPSNPQVVYAGFENGTIQVSTDGGVTFTSLAAQPFSETFITGLSVDPANPKAITASVSVNGTRYSAAFPHVAEYSYTTTPGSGTWTAITGNLPNVAVSRVVYDQGALIAATDAGVYGTGTVSGGTTSWSPVGTGLPKAQVQDLFVDPVTSNLYAVTHGRGAWMLPVQAPDTVTVTSPGNQTTYRNVQVSLQVTGTSSGGNPLTWSATGLPTGLSIGSSTGTISGQPHTAGSFSVTVTARDKTGASGSAPFTWTVKQVVGNAITGVGGKCLDDHNRLVTNGNTVDIYTCNGTGAQRWTFSGGELIVLGECLNDPHSGGGGTAVVIWTCNGHASQQWTHRSNGEYVLKLNGLCLTDPSSSKVNGTPVQVRTCHNNKDQHWSGP